MSNRSTQTPKCNQCGSDLIIIESKVSKNGTSFSTATITTYRCSNKACQDEIDKRTAKRIALRTEQEQARADRANKVTPKA